MTKLLALAPVFALSFCATIPNMTPCEKAWKAANAARAVADAAEDAAGMVCPLG